MSLILDALKKSDQERRRDRAPDLQTIHRPPPRPGAAPRRAPWVWGVALLATVNLAALGFWWQWQQRQPAMTAAAAAPPQPTAPAPQASAALVPAPTTTSGAATPAPLAVPVPVPATTTAVAPTTAAPERPLPIQELWEVPDPVRHALPAMTFSFHVYSANPERRTIIINDRRMRQGDTVGEGVLLEEITEDGVILAVDRHRVHIPVLSDW